jgi:hypothetical protein
MQTDGVAITVLNPRGLSPGGEKITAAAPLSGLQGKKIGILNNLKSGGAALLSHIEEALTSEVPDIELRTWRVPFAASPEEKAPRLKEMAGYSDGVFALMGD